MISQGISVVAHAKLKDQALAERAADTFRLHGYEGTTLNRLAEAMDLKKPASTTASEETRMRS